MLAPPVQASGIDVGGGVEYFVWEEFDDSGRKFLDETGQRYFVDLVGTNPISRDWSIDFGGRVYSATVDYDGETMSGIPVTTDTDYNGYRLELGFTHFTARRRKLESGEWLIRFAIGTDRWRRSLQDSRLSDGTPVSGYVERYTTHYATAGANYRREGAWEFGFGAKAPFYTSEEVDIGGSEVTLNPEGQLSLFAGMAFTLAPQWSIAFDYDSYRFAKSDPEEGYYQPESNQDTLGASVHFRF
jgi:hypothetical protein